MNELKHNDSTESIKDGLALAFSFIIVAVYLAFTPKYFGNETVARIASIVSFSIGIIGLSIKLNELSGKDEKIGLDDFGLGLTLIIIWAVSHNYFSQIWVKLLLVLLLLIAIFGMLRGLINIIHNIVIDSSSFRKKIVRILLVIAQIVAFIAALLQCMQILKILK